MCHSLGGLVVKQVKNPASIQNYANGGQALVSSAKKKNYDAIYRATKAIFFFGTPHRGARVLESSKKVKLLENLAKAAKYNIPENLRTILAPRSNELFAINDDFSDIKGNIAIVNFYERKVTEILGTLVCLCLRHKP